MQNHCIWNADPIFGSRFFILDREIFIDINNNKLVKNCQKVVIDPDPKIHFPIHFLDPCNFFINENICKYFIQLYIV